MVIRQHVHRIAATATAALTLTGLLGLAPAQAAQTTNNTASYLVVYNNNIENMLSPTTCSDTTNPKKNDFEKLFTYIKAQKYSPDIFTIQQISNQAKLDALTRRMTAELGVSYKGVIAIQNPNSGNKDTSACSKEHQTNAVIYRSNRLTARSTLTWRSDSPGTEKDSKGPCRNNEGGFQERTENVAVRLTDNLAKKDVIVASIHWPTLDSSNGPLCAGENITELNDRTQELGTGILTIASGDTNAEVDQSQEREPWGAKAKALKFQDAYDFRICDDASCNAPDTFKDRRIDFLLSKGGLITNRVTISEAAAGGRYSDHLALKADISY